MSGKKLGLEGRYKALSTGIKKSKNTISINPMLDDINRGVGMPGTFIARRMLLSKGPANMVKPKPTVNKKVLESKPIKSKSQAAKGQQEAGKYIKTPGYLTGGQTKIDANKDGKITGEDFKILKARKKGKKVAKLYKGSPGTPQNQDEYRAKYGAPKRKTTSTGNKMKQRSGKE